jgi:6-phosphofructokinase 1
MAKVKKPKVKRIGVLCSGGDSSGMNPAVRAVVRAATYYGIEVYGIFRGFQGMIENKIKPLGARSVSNIVSRGGTILKTARCLEFKKKSGRKKAIANLHANGIDGLVVIGGDGSFHGAHALAMESNIKVIGVPGTIDNDIAGTDYTIGYDTAVNVAMDAIDKIKDTAASHERLFFVEVMGRSAGYIALESGIASGAEDILIPETKTSPKAVADKIKKGMKNGKTSSIVVVAEGDDAGGAFKLAEKVSKMTGIKPRISILGHMQRGGSPTAIERMMASRMGVAAVEKLVAGKSNLMVGIINMRLKYSQIDHAWKGKREFKPDIMKLNEILSV